MSIRFNQSLLVLAASLVLGSAISQAAFAQGATTLRDPLIPGEQTTVPGLPAAEGAPPPPGDGPTPVGVTPGMTGPPTLEPWVPAVPANSVNVPVSGIPLPVSPSVATPPGVLGPALTGFVPPAPSTPGADPGPLTSPAGFRNAANRVNINPNGGLPGRGGYNGTISRVRRGGQTTVQYERRGRHSVIGGGGNSQDIITEFGPLAGSGIINGVPTGVGYNNGPPGSNNSLRQSTIDLGGGQRLKFAGMKVSTGSSIQDFGKSAMRFNPFRALRAHKSTDFGQGRHDQPIFSNTTTSFGQPFGQISAANAGAQKLGQQMVPTAIITSK